MELSPFQRFAAFAVIVLVLAGLGAYLFLPQSSAGGTPRPTPSGPASPGHGSSPASPSAPASSGLAVPDIYQWLPFTPSDLASASATTISFAAHYGTFSYADSAQAYLAPMRPEMTSQLAVELGRAFAAPGLAATRASTRQTSTATASILALRAFGPSSLTFVVAIAQRITSTRGRSQQRTDYAVTLTGTGSSWQVSDIELSSAGNN